MKTSLFAVALCCTDLLPAQNQAPKQDTVVVPGTAAPVPLDESDRSVNVVGNLPRELLLFGGFQDFLQLDSSVDLQGASRATSRFAAEPVARLSS